MKQPDVLVISDRKGGFLQVDSYETFKQSILIQYGNGAWKEMLSEWYKSLLFHQRYAHIEKELKEMGAIVGSKNDPSFADALDNSVIFIRSQVVREYGNGYVVILESAMNVRWEQLRTALNEGETEKVKEFFEKNLF